MKRGQVRGIVIDREKMVTSYAEDKVLTAKEPKELREMKKRIKSIF